MRMTRSEYRRRKKEQQRRRLLRRECKEKNADVKDLLAERWRDRGHYHGSTPYRWWLYQHRGFSGWLKDVGGPILCGMKVYTSPSVPRNVMALARYFIDRHGKQQVELEGYLENFTLPEFAP